MIWRLIARFLARPAIRTWLVNRAMRTPYTHLTQGNSDEPYMLRYWLFNPYPGQTDGGRRRWGDWLPSVRIHYIVREDRDRHLHDHPWDARTIILKGCYVEHRQEDDSQVPYLRDEGDTATLKFGEYHTISAVPPAGVWTLFITYRYRGVWGFLVDGNKIPWREYLGIK